ncbi:hypothetical protein ACVWYN_001968 [Pedobacter sp. UYP24]
MDISTYLKILLKTQNKVGIPGLGTIYKRKIAGRYDSDTNIFIPPSYVLDFTRDILESSHLKDYICKKKNISLESADYFINGFFEDIIAQIDLKNEASLGAIGTLIKQSDQWIIKSKGTGSVDFGFYGLPSVDENIKENEPQIVHEPLTDEQFSFLEPEKGQKILEKDDQKTFEEISEHPAMDNSIPIQGLSTIETNIADKAPDALEQAEKEEKPDTLDQEAKEVYKPEEITESGTANIWHFDSTNSPAANKENSETDYSEDRGLVFWQKLMIVFAILAVALGGLYLIKPSVFNTVTKKNKNLIVKPRVQPQVIVTDTIAKIDTSKVAVLPVDSLQDVVAVDSATTWEIMAASLTKREVKQYIAEMKAKGYTAKAILNMPGRRIKMSIATFNDEKTAEEARKILVKKLKNKDLYIHQNKHTHKPI